MWASWLGKVSHNKQQQAMNPSSLIAVVAIDAVLIERRQSARDTNTSNATRNKATATNSAFESQGDLADEQDKSVMRGLWVSRRNSLHDDDYRRSGVIAATPVHRNKQEALPWQEASSKLGKYMPLISYDAIVRINESKNKQQKQAQPPWHVERATRARHLQHEQRKRVDRHRQGHHPQTTKRARATTTTATPYYFGGIPKIK
jgi:hypothetical protein